MANMEASRTAQRIAARCYARRARSLGRGISRIFDDALRTHGMTAAQLNLLVAVSLADGARANDLVDILDIEKSTLSRNLARMQERGWVTTTTEGREQRLAISAAGEKLLLDAYPAWKEAQRRVRAHYGDAVLDGLEAL